MMDAVSDQFDQESREEDVPATLDIELNPPVEFQKKLFTTLHLREPTSGQMEQALAEVAHGRNSYTEHRMMTKLLASVAKVPHEVVLKIPESQVEKCVRFFTDIALAGQRTGET